MSTKCPKCQHENPDETVFCGKCGTKFDAEIDQTKTLETPTDELTRGYTFADRYEIIEELGRGGMGRVFRVEDVKAKEEIALKIIKPEISADKKIIERFRNELNTTRKIRHKNVCGMYDLGESEGTYYITMEYVAGEDLKSLIRRVKKITVDTAISITKQICEGLNEAHRLDVIHRDLKPSNIMIDKSGNVRIMDFGIARSLKTKGITGIGVVIGTPEYMSPEQVEGKEADHLSDIYSLGIILYEMLTGKIPFEGDTAFAVGLKHKSEEPEDPRKYNSNIPEDLSLLVMRCLEKDKANRFYSAEELRSELSKVEEGIPTTEKVVPEKAPITSGEITVQFRVKKLLIPAVAVIAVLIIGLFLWRPWPRQKSSPIPTDKPSLAILCFDNVADDKSLDFWRDGIAELFTTDLMQSKFLNVLTRDRVLSILESLNLESAKSYRTEDLIKVAEEGRVNHTVTGSFIKAGENILLTVVLQKPHTGEVIDSHRVTCRGEVDIQPKVDELTLRIKAKLDLNQQQITTDLDREVGKITTSSPEALQAYLEGSKIFNRGDWRSSLSFFENAVSIDPDFAMAYNKLGAAFSNLGNVEKKVQYYGKAFELADRMSDRERYQIQGDYYRIDWRTQQEAVEAFLKLLELYPDDPKCNLSLGNLYRLIDEWDKAIERYETNIQNREYSSYRPYFQAAETYGHKGMFDKAMEILQLYLSRDPYHHRIRYKLADIYLDQGKYELAHSEADKALLIAPSLFYNINLKGKIYLCQRDLTRAEEQYIKLLELDEKTDQLIGRESLMLLNIARGTFEEAQKQARMGIELAAELADKSQESVYYQGLVRLYLLSQKPGKALEESEKCILSAEESGAFDRLKKAYQWKGLCLIKLGLLDEAARTAEELKGLIEEGINRKAIRDYYYLLGRIEMKQQQFSEAILHFEQTIPLLQKNGYYMAFYHEALALAYFSSGDMARAEDFYRKIISLPTGMIEYGDVYVKSHYMLGTIYEQQGNTVKAIELYEKFLSLWQSADPGLPEVEDAKKRLAGLK